MKTQDKENLANEVENFLKSKNIEKKEMRRVLCFLYKRMKE